MEKIEDETLPMIGSRVSFGIVKFSIRSHGELAGALKRLEQKHN